jgi:hypothetical protein
MQNFHHSVMSLQIRELYGISVSQMKWIFQSLHALGLTIHLYQNMHRNATGAKFFISRIPLTNGQHF